MPLRAWKAERGRELSARTHPGASFLDLDTDLADLSDQGAAATRSQARAVRGAASRAESDRRLAVAYDQSMTGSGPALVASPPFRPRGRFAVLDGGISAWLRAAHGRWKRALNRLYCAQTSQRRHDWRATSSCDGSAEPGLVWVFDRHGRRNAPGRTRPIDRSAGTFGRRQRPYANSTLPDGLLDAERSSSTAARVTPVSIF